MAYSDFKYPAVLADLQLTLGPSADLFAAVPPVAPGPAILGGLPIGMQLGPLAHSEFSRSVWMVGPVLADLWSRYGGRVCLIGGAEFDADPDAGLNGACDFVVCRAPQQSAVIAPVLVIIEAKKDSIPNGLGQCIAGMVGAQRFNARAGTPTDPIYGATTTGSSWRFLRLSGTTVTLDLVEYGIGQADKLLGILMHMVGPPPASAPAAA